MQPKYTKVLCCIFSSTSLLNTSHVWFRGYVKRLYLQFYHELVCIHEIKGYRLTQRNSSCQIPHISSSLLRGQYILLHVYTCIFISPWQSCLPAATAHAGGSLAWISHTNTEVMYLNTEGRESQHTIQKFDIVFCLEGFFFLSFYLYSTYLNERLQLSAWCHPSQTTANSKTFLSLCLFSLWVCHPIKPWLNLFYIYLAPGKFLQPL